MALFQASHPDIACKFMRAVWFSVRLRQFPLACSILSRICYANHAVFCWFILFRRFLENRHSYICFIKGDVAAHIREI